ncbi:DoxX family protein [Methylobacterium nonmethylotrophicum]|uniref:DoxX family protein n=1 Tax=Methylobacterium nonmethylotrophicum TaxID=1141884 RepID=A0A4Z0NHQ5_9HYPH|nr:DoxX family protein [Methylobacterium nonmethylotrophicum]TGD95525.1 DoxX family protein [Methylobacterium nonmethylotrophicum]
MTSTRTWPSLAALLLRVLITALFVIAAGMKFAAVPFEVAVFARFGYPLWFMYVVGAAQLYGAVLLWVRGGTAFGALLLMVIMVGAAVSHLRAGDPVALALPALVLLILLAGLAYRHRDDVTLSLRWIAAQRA